MQRSRAISLLLAAWWVCLSLPAQAQENLHAQLFKEADSTRSQAAQASAEFLSPRNWKQAIDSYAEADQLFKKGEALYEVKEKLRSSVSYLRIALQVCAQFGSTFGDLLAAQADAKSAYAESHAAELWARGEARLRAAGQELEDGNLSAARREASFGVGLYRAAEVEAIKSTTLARARDLLRRADIMDVKRSAPRTLNRAKSLYARAAAVIQENRSDNAEARRLAEDAAYEAAHAIYIHQYSLQLKGQDKGTEDAILASEEPLRQIAEALGLAVQFDAGWDQPLHQILQGLRRQQLRTTRLADSLRLQESRLTALKKSIAMLKSGFPSGSADDESTLVEQAEDLQKLDAVVARITTLLGPGDGRVIKEGNDVVLRLYGISFGPGNTIESRSFPLLAKVQDAIREFPGCQVSVEGHTDSRGSELSNQMSTEARAEAIAQYLKAGLPPTVPILSHGYGSTRPVSDSTAPEGKALNRRIDIVIVPQWAIVGR